MKCQDWWVDPLTEKDEWRCVWVVAGELFKQISLWKLLKLFAEANHKYWTAIAHHLVTVSFQLLCLQQHAVTVIIMTMQYFTINCTVSQFGYSLSKPVYSCSLNTNGGLECLNSTTRDDHTRDLGVSCESVQNSE